MTVQKEIPRIYYTHLKFYGKAIALGDDGAWYLIVDYAKNRWGFKLVDVAMNEQLTSWMTVKRLEELRQPRKFKVLRKYLAERWGKDMVDLIIEHILLVVEEHIEELKESAKKDVKEESEEEFDAETKRRAMALLTDPAFFYKLGKLLEYGFHVSRINKDRFVIGEERNKRLLGPLLIGASKLGMTSIIKLLGDPGTAKDTMVRMWLQLLNPGIKHIERSYVTAAALRYSTNIQEADLIYIPDSPELKGETGRHLRFMRADDGGLISEYAMRDVETGEMITKTVRLPVKGVVTTSNAVTVDTALESGMWTLQTNNSKELTLKVQLEKLKLHAGERELFPEDELKVWRCAFHILLNEDLPDEIPRIPYAEKLIQLLSIERTEARRDPDKLCNLIELIAWMRRFQKPYDKWGEADIVDLYIALQIGLDAITTTISDLDPFERQVYEIVKNSPEPLTVRQVAEKTKYQYTKNYSTLEKLVDKGWLVKDKQGNKNVYSVLKEESEEKLSSIFFERDMSPVEVMKKVLRLARNFHTFTGDINILKIIDPITGETVKVTKKGPAYFVTTEPPSEDLINYPYPPRKRESSERSEKQVSDSQKEHEKLSKKVNESNLEPFIRPQKFKQEKDIALISERPKKRVLGRGCYDCKHFKPAEEVGYFAGYCDYRKGNLPEETVSRILREGCDGFELRGDLGIRHWDQWDKKERNVA